MKEKISFDQFVFVVFLPCQIYEYCSFDFIGFIRCYSYSNRLSQSSLINMRLKSLRKERPTFEAEGKYEIMICFPTSSRVSLL